MNSTMLDECFRIDGRSRWYLIADDFQAVLHGFMDNFNIQRTHQGYATFCQTPAQALFNLLAVIRSLPPVEAHPTAFLEEAC